MKSFNTFCESVNTADKKPENYVDADGKTRTRMVPVKKDIVKTEESDPCWDTHKQVGMKKKNGKEVPNCVPKEEVEVDEALERDGPNKPFNIGSGIAKSDAGKAYKDRKAQQRRDLNKKNDPGAAKKGLGLGVLDKDKARVKAKKNSMKEDVESVEEAKSYRNVMVTHDGETFKSKSFSTKKAADDHHYKMTQATDKRGKKIYKSITTESFNPGKPLAEVLGKAAFKRREHEFEAELDRKNDAKVAAKRRKLDGEKHHIYINKKVWKKNGKPVEFANKRHATSAASAITKKDPKKAVTVTHHTTHTAYGDTIK